MSLAHTLVAGRMARPAVDGAARHLIRHGRTLHSLRATVVPALWENGVANRPAVFRVNALYSGRRTGPACLQVGLQSLRFASTSGDPGAAGKPQGDPEKQVLKTPKESAVTSTASSKDEPKTTLWQKVKKEAKHYWDGTKLLGYEMKVSFKLAMKVAAGYQLTRREDRQLKRTVQDIIRLVPFSVFVLVPFAELLLPVALKVFPNLLPSTYESGKAREKKRAALSDTRNKVSQYLQDKMGNAKMIPDNCTPEQRQNFQDFFKLARSGEQPPRELVLNVARLFKDDMMLDNMSRTQLAGIAKYIGLQPYGTSMVLRYLIRHRMRQIKADDYVIEREGVDSLNALELQNACSSRGFKIQGVSTGRLRDDLNNWLTLRLKEKVPSTLLVLGSAYSYDNHDLDSFYDGISAVLAAMPLEVYHEAELEVSSDAATNEQRLEFLKEQEEMIKDENKEEEDSGHVITVQDHQNIDEDATDADVAAAEAEETKPGAEMSAQDEAEKEKIAAASASAKSGSKSSSSSQQAQP